MAFPNAHLYLTAHWVNGGAPGETGQVGIRFDTTTPASLSLVTACMTAWSTFWAAATSNISSDYRLIYLRLASVGVNGQYVPGTIAYDGTFGSPVAGQGTINFRYPLQVATVATLLTALPRGQASKGRIYLPPIGQALNSSYRFAIADANSRSNTLAALLNSLNTALPGKAAIFSKSTKASTAGAKATITGVQHGDRPDVQRRRAKSMVEAYGVVGNVT
jgi:hypothetical protein